MNREAELSLVNNPHTSIEILQKLAQSQDDKIAEGANLHIKLAGETRGDWYELADNIISQKDLGQNDLLVYQLLEFACVADYFISEWIPWQQIAKSIEKQSFNMPVLWRNRLLSRLVNQRDVETDMWLATYEDMPMEIRKKLIKNSSVEVLSIISLQPSFSPLWFDNVVPIFHQPIMSFYFIKWYRDEAPPCVTKCGISRLLAQHNNVKLRKLAIDCGGGCSDELYEKLALDDEIELRKKVASSPVTPKYIREKLATDESEEVRQAFKQNYYLPFREKLINYADIFQRRDFIRQFEKFSKLNKLSYQNNSHNSPELLNHLVEIIAEDRSLETYWLREILAKAIDTPANILEKLTTSSEIQIRYYLAKRKDLRWDLSEKLWQKLIVDPENDQIYDDRSIFHCSSYGIPINLTQEEEALPLIIENYAQSDNLFTRYITLTSPLLFPYLFKKYVKSSFWLDRYALAQNPAIPEKIREILTQDANIIVREMAKAKGKIPQSQSNSSKAIIPEYKKNSQNLLATLKTLIKYIITSRTPSPRERPDYIKYEPILWHKKSDNQQYLNFIDLMINQGILTEINLNRFNLDWQKEFDFNLRYITKSTSEKTINQYQHFWQWLQNNCVNIKVYQIDFGEKENIFKIIIGQSKYKKWVGFSTYYQYVSTNIEQIKTQLPQKDLSQNSLIEKLLLSSNFIEIEPISSREKYEQFFSSCTTNSQKYLVGKNFNTSIFGRYYEEYIFGKTLENNWLILKIKIQQSN